MQAERKDRLQAILDTLKEAKEEATKLYAEAIEARDTFDDESDEYSTLDGISDSLNDAGIHIGYGIEDAEQVFGADGEDDEPEQDEEEPEDDSGSMFF
jgi:hypothetical protein